MTTIAARHERHMMRQRGAGARAIPTNFGFIFQAGPIQVIDPTTLKSPLPTNSPSTALAHTEPQHIPESSFSVQEPAQKRKRIFREEEDEDVWFRKRTKRTTSREQNDHAIPTATLDTGLDLTQQEVPTEKKPAKPKVVRKRVLVPRSRQKDSLKPQPNQPISIPEPVAEDLPPPKKAKPSQNLQNANIAEKTQKKTVSQKRAVRKHVQESVEPAQPSLEESTQTIPTLPLKEENIDGEPKYKTTRQRKVAKQHPEKSTEQQIDETSIDAQPGPPHETNPPPKKKKLVRRVRVPRTTTRRAPSEQGDSVNTVNKDDTKPSVSTNDITPALSEAVATAPIAKRSSKAPKRIFFNDDSDIDLDQMLSGIAAIAGTKGDTKTSTSKSGRVARKKIAV